MLGDLVRLDDEEAAPAPAQPPPVRQSPHQTLGRATELGIAELRIDCQFSRSATYEHVFSTPAMLSYVPVCVCDFCTKVNWE